MAASTQQRIFMTGATGYIGTRVTEYALRAGYTVHGLSRSPSGASKLRTLGAVPVNGTLASLDVLRAESAAADIVIHLADAMGRRLRAAVRRRRGPSTTPPSTPWASGLAASESSRKNCWSTLRGAGVVAPAADEGDETDETGPPRTRIP